MNSLISLVEMILIFLTYNVIFSIKIFQNVFKFIPLAIINVILYSNFELLNITTRMIIIVLLYSLFIFSIYKRELGISIIEVVISFIFFYIVELLIVIPMNFITENMLIVISVVTVVYLLLLNLLVKILNKFNINSHTLLDGNALSGVTIVNILTFLFGIKICKDNNGNIESIFFDLLILIVFMLIINIYCFKSFSNIIREKNNLKVKESLNPVINELIHNFRANEHEFKNHLTTLYSMVELSGENSKDIIKYIDNINTNTLLKDMLYIESDIIKAVLYNKYLECNKQNIEFKYKFNSGLNELNIENTDIVILLSNLLNNAIEAVQHLVEKEIYIEFNKEEKHIIEVKNTVENIDLSKVNNLFKKGYSTKGQNRGYGLYNIKKIVEKYKGQIQLSLENNYLIIRIVI